MDIPVIWIPADEAQPIELIEVDREDLDTYQRLVGGNIEVLPLVFPPASYFFNEEYRGSDLAINPRATQVLWSHNPHYAGCDPIQGDVFITGDVDPEGNETAVPGNYKELLQPVKFRVDIVTGSDRRWVSNGVIHDTRALAEAAGQRLFENWTQVSKFRVVPDSTPTRERVEPLAE
ncbi:hypothetical protein ACFWP5_08725 [Streptomyces sp. NPDC058469]|uniref:DUF3846 domain-containing protein n=1 Tax=Streptomyces sp. NPDC058469 TaxID=3346514 RepID=UPI00364907E4